jgi:phosphate transport system substrate-binding protein
MHMLGSGNSALFLGVCLAVSAGLSQLPATAQSPPQSTPQSTSQSLARAANPSAPAAGSSSISEMIAMLKVIDPYRPTGQQSGTVHIYGSTAMDNMAHAWADDFKKFHPQVQVEISAAGSGDAFGKLKQNPQALVMLSRPVKPEELQQLKSDAIKSPVAFVVAREALGVFVHSSNPLKSISGEQLRAVFTKQTNEADLKWKLLGIAGEMAEKPIHLVARAETSGTQAFLRDFVFGGLEMRATENSHGSNSDVLGALAQDPLGITICGLRANGVSVKSLPLVIGGQPIATDDAAVMNGRYPLTRSLSLVVDLSQAGAEAKTAQELVQFALCRSGQLYAIQAGFFPAELPTLKAGLNLLQRDHLR